MNFMSCVEETEVILGIWRGNSETISGRYKDADGIYQSLVGARIVFTATWKNGGLLRLSTDNGAIYVTDTTTWVLPLAPWQTRMFPPGLKSTRFEVEMQYRDPSTNMWRELTRWRGWFDVDGGISDEGIVPDAGAYTNTHWRFPIHFESFGVAMDLRGKIFEAGLYDENLNLVMTFGGVAGDGTIDLSEAANGYVILDATLEQHQAVPSGSYTWQLIETAAGYSGDLAVSELADVLAATGP